MVALGCRLGFTTPWPLGRQDGRGLGGTPSVASTLSRKAGASPSPRAKQGQTWGGSKEGGTASQSAAWVPPVACQGILSRTHINLKKKVNECTRHGIKNAPGHLLPLPGGYWCCCFLASGSREGSRMCSRGKNVRVLAALPCTHGSKPFSPARRDSASVR